MDSLVIEGGTRLKGTARINGSKNAALPIMAGALLANGPTVLRDVPNLSDINHQVALLRELAYPHSMESPGAFAWDSPFDERLRDLLRRLAPQPP